MAMIDTGIIIQIGTAGVTTGDPATPVAAWTKLKDCLNMPALIQPGAKISTDYVGEEYITDIAGKKSLSGLDFTFAYDGTNAGDQFKALKDMSAAGTKHWLRVAYPDGTKFEMAVKVDVSLVAVAPSSQLQYTASFSVQKNAVAAFADKPINIVEVGGTDPLEQ